MSSSDELVDVAAANLKMAARRVNTVAKAGEPKCCAAACREYYVLTASGPVDATPAEASINPDGRRGAPRRRLKAPQRRERIVEQAAIFFAEHGFGGQTRELAMACGLSQRMLYNHFPSKAALVEEVFRRTVVEPFAANWSERLRVGTLPIEDRLVHFYEDYRAAIFNRQWTRLFFFGALARDEEGVDALMNVDYATPGLFELVRTMARESAASLGLPPITSDSAALQIGWLLHGMISHAAIRRTLLRIPGPLGESAETRLIIRAFLASLPTAILDMGPAD